MSWNYRMLVQPDGDNYWFSVHEVYYDEDGVPYAYSKNQASVNGSLIDDLVFSLNKIREAIENQPILWADYRFPEEFDYDKEMKQ